MGLYLGHQNHKDFCLCGAPRCAQVQKFRVYPTDKDYPSVLHMVSKRTLAYKFLYSSFCMNEIENVKHVVVSSHFFPQNQNNEKYVTDYMPAQGQDIGSFHKAFIKKK